MQEAMGAARPNGSVGRGGSPELWRVDLRDRQPPNSLPRTPLKSTDKTASRADSRVWSLATFVLPFLALLGIGAFGLWREKAIGTADQQRRLEWEAESAAKVANRILRQDRTTWAWAEATVAADGRPGGRAWFSQTPMPQEESEASLAFAAGRFEEVVERYPGVLSPGGLPLGPAAAFRLLLVAPDDGVALEAAREVRELAFAFPSLLSAELMEGTDAELKKRGLLDSRAEPWRERWRKVERVARAFDALLETPLPAVGTSVRELCGEPWRVEIRNDGRGHLVHLLPLAETIESIREEWLKVPVGSGTFLALTATDRDLLFRPEGATDWPQVAMELEGGGLRVLALGDPGAAAKTIRLRVAVLGGLGLLAGVMVSMAWWRQQRAVRLQSELARQKDDFLSTVSHELRTPVASLQLLAENLASGTIRDPDAIAVYHQRLLREARGLAATTEHLLDFSLMERGQKAYRFGPVDPARLAEDVRAVLLPLATLKGIELTVEVLSIGRFPTADAEGVRRIALNLGDNAIKYSPHSGRVEIRIGPANPEHWSIRVRDHGPGIPVVDQARIFDRFFRGGAVLDRQTRGTGIGLAVARHIAEGHGGTVELTESSGAGSVFTCTLPLEPSIAASSDENPVD